MAMDHPLPSIQLQFFLDWIPTSFEQSLMEFYIILLEEHHVSLEVLEVGICFSLWPKKLIRVAQ
jgi:hypothetical protein